MSTTTDQTEMVISTKENDQHRYAVWKSIARGHYSMAILDKKTGQFVNVDVRNLAVMLRDLPEEAFGIVSGTEPPLNVVPVGFGNGVSVEEDGDEVFTKMPKRCTRFGCVQSKRDIMLTKKRGFMICPQCGVSYGKAVDK